MARQKSITKYSPTDPEDEQASRQLYEEVGKLVADHGPDYELLATLLDKPSRTIQATLRKERRKLALALLPTVSRNILSYTGRYYHLLDRATQALEYRWNHDAAIQTMSMDDILGTIRTIGSEIRTVQQNVAWSVPQEIELETKQTFDPANVVDVLRQIAIARQQQAADADFEEIEDPGPSGTSNPPSTE